jgi:membrane protein
MSWLFFALLSALFAALTAVFAKLGLQGLDSDFATFIRTLFIVGIVALWVSFLGKWQPLAAVGGRQWLFLALSAAATGLSWLFYFKALQLGQASHVAPVDKLSVVFVALFSVTFLGERLSTREWLGIVLIVVGVICLALPSAAPVSQVTEQGYDK